MRSRFWLAMLAGILLANPPFETTALCQPAVLEAPRRVAEQAGQSLGIASISNMRDVGGYRTSDGLLVRKKLLYRSNQLAARVPPDDLKKLELLGLQCVYDLRRDNERSAAPDMLPSGMKSIWLNVMADSPRTARTAPGEVEETSRAVATSSDAPAEDPYLETYRKFVSLPSAQKAYSQLFTDLQKESNLPALFHCAAGKDRAGWAAAALLSLLGVPREVVFKDYLLSNDYLSPRLRVKSEHLQSAFNEVDAKYGTIENYFAMALNIDAAGQQALKDRFLARQTE